MKNYLGKILLWVVGSYYVIRSCFAFNEIAWGTGLWWGEYSLKWGLLFFLYIMFCISVVSFAGFALWRYVWVETVIEKVVMLREQFGTARWFLGTLVFILPVWFFQYTPWGLVFSDIYIRLFVCFFIVVILAFLMAKGRTLFGWLEFLIALLLTSGEFVIGASFMRVTDYPFSLGWSEGNRLWDYSIMFGSELYNYPPDRKITPFLDIGRQFVGGIPFLLPVVTIEMERFWVALLGLLPYTFLGLAAFQFERKNLSSWALLTLWALIFLIQGPIHPPLVLCAAGVALLVWRRPLWYAIPVVFLIGLFAVNSRYTWIFAPGIWIGMLEIAGATLQESGKLSVKDWARGISLGIAGVFGGYFGPKIPSIFAGDTDASVGTFTASVASFTTSVASSVSDQPLLWYRLLPNATYGNGILVGLLFATLPLIIFLVYLIVNKKWILNVWQYLAITIPLIAFLVVGLIASTKIGGGGDLHNMDMFIIGLLFTAVLAWRSCGKEWLVRVESHPLWIKFVVVLLLTTPGIQPLRDMRSFDFVKDLPWLTTLRDIPATATASEKSMDMYPSQETVDSALDTIRDEVDLALSKDGGGVLFLDQRQLLTFGYIPSVPLVPEYEKKVLMNQALSSNLSYFQTFYNDLKTRRFQLIVSEHLRTPIKDSSFEFGEENNAWVKWVSTPVLCYYESKIKLKEVGVELFVPKEGLIDCTFSLPK